MTTIKLLRIYGFPVHFECALCLRGSLSLRLLQCRSWRNGPHRSTVADQQRAYKNRETKMHLFSCCCCVIKRNCGSIKKITLRISGSAPQLCIRTSNCQCCHGDSMDVCVNASNINERCCYNHVFQKHQFT